jgi:hypothetical protein
LSNKKIKMSTFKMLTGISILWALNAAAFEYKKEVQETKLDIGKRQSLTSRPLVFPRSQLKYNLYRNYLHWWIDRPLRHNRSIRKPKNSKVMVGRESWQREVEILKKYDVDGMANLATNHGHLQMYRETDQYLKDFKASPNQVRELPEFWYAGKLTPNLFKIYDDVTAIAVKSPYSLRHKGKAVISTYVADRWKPEQHVELIDKLRKTNGDKFVILLDTRRKIHELEKEFARTGRVSPETINRYKKYLRSYMDVSDGIMNAGLGYATAGKTETYERLFAEDFVRKYQIPLLIELYSEPKYKGKKLLALSASIGYKNHRSGVTKTEAGTRRLRQSFSAALSANPEYIVMPEWNEVNENTCLQPTVSSSRSTGRIIRYIMSVIKKEPPTPWPGDNTAIPNLVFSTRRQIKLGERLRIEMLNIPDSLKPADYKVTLTLRNTSGKLIYRFPQETFNSRRLYDITYQIPSEQFAAYRTIVPELTVINENGKSFNFGLMRILVRPTFCSIYQYVKQPLRDLISPTVNNCNFSSSNGAFKASGKLIFPEKLISLELLRNGREVDAVADKPDIDYSKYDVIFMNPTAGGSGIYPRGTITVKNVSDWIFQPSNIHGYPYYRREDKVVKTWQKFNTAFRPVYILIPRGETDKAVIELDFKDGKYTAPVKTIMQKGSYAFTMPGRGYVRFDRFEKIPDHPQPLNRKTVKFILKSNATQNYPVFHLRAITESGKIWRSHPVVSGKPEKSTQQLNVWSETKNKPVSVTVNKSLIPDFQYQFNPVCGTMLPCKRGPEWFAELGGGFEYGMSYNRHADNKDSSLPRAPVWVLDNGKYMLKFNGESNYAIAPAEVLPRGSFKLKISLKPERKNGTEMIFRHHGHYIGSLTLKRDHGLLSASWTNINLKHTQLKTKLRIPPGKWSKISVVNDLKNITFRVNGKSKSFPYPGMPLYMTPSVIGGMTKPGFGVTGTVKPFKGLLSEISIRHAAK